jgi:uroporphyrinogen-III decarboxylase
MSSHTDRVRRAIEFGRPDMVPMDLVDVPFLYDAYGTRSPLDVQIPAGAESFDSAWCTYHWTLRPTGTNQNGEILREDEWGCKQVVPADRGSAYSVIERPDLSSVDKVLSHPWPRPEGTDAFFEARQAIIRKHYPDRFINGFIDPGPLLVAFELLGYEGLMIRLMEEPHAVTEVLRRVVEYQKALIPRFRQMGAHMITIIDEIAGAAGLMFSPEIFRKDFVGLYEDLIAETHRNGMYASLLLDGNISAILPDLLKLDIDVHLLVQPHATGLDVLQECFHGRRAVKLAVDMVETMVTGSPADIAGEVDDYVRRFHTGRGGLIFQAFRWHRPEYDPLRVEAQITAMQRHRPGA